MKYIRTKDGIYKVILVSPLGFVRIDKRDGTYPDVFEKDIIKQADTVEELIDELVIDNPENWEKKPFVANRNFDTFLNKDNAKYQKENNIKTYGAIWTDKGLIYVAKMNDKGELELL